MKILTAACLCFASLIIYAAEINGFEISPSGAISKGGVSFAPGRHLKNWHYVGIRENNLQLDKAASKTGKDGIEIQGLWDAKEGVTYRFKQTILPEGENKIRCKISLETDPLPRQNTWNPSVRIQRQKAVHPNRIFHAGQKTERDDLLDKGR